MATKTYLLTLITRCLILPLARCLCQLKGNRLSESTIYLPILYCTYWSIAARLVCLSCTVAPLSFCLLCVEFVFYVSSWLSMIIPGNWELSADVILWSGALQERGEGVRGGDRRHWAGHRVGTDRQAVRLQSEGLQDEPRCIPHAVDHPAVEADPDPGEVDYCHYISIIRYLSISISIYYWTVLLGLNGPLLVHMNSNDYKLITTIPRVLDGHDLCLRVSVLFLDAHNLP